MSLNSVMAFTLLLKKISRKGSLRKNLQQRMKKSRKQNDDEESSQQKQQDQQEYQQEQSDESCSSSVRTSISEEVGHQAVVDVLVGNNKKASIVSTSSINPLQPQLKASIRASLIEESTVILTSHQTTEKQAKTKTGNDVNQLSTMPPPTEHLDGVRKAEIKTRDFGYPLDSPLHHRTLNSQISMPPSTEHLDSVEREVKIRDFAYLIDSPLHHRKEDHTLAKQQSIESLSSGKDARVLFDFLPETEHEIKLIAGQTIWVQYRQCPGWLVADVEDETGLVPESYVEFI